MSEKNNRSYTSSNLTVLKDLAPVRKRPGMYIGSTDKKGLHHLVWEIVDNSVDEALAGYCNDIKVIINPEGFPENSISISDNGRGMPIDIHEEEGVSGVELIVTKLHSGGKFDNSSYKVSGGLHGVGAAVTNALSDILEIKVRRDGVCYKQTFERGVRKTDLLVVGDCDKDNNGTTVTFLPDETMFKHAVEECEMKFDFDMIAKRLELTSYLNKLLKLSVTDNKTGRTESFYSKNGLNDIVLKSIKSEDKLINKEPFYFSDEEVIDYPVGDSLSMEVEFSCSFENEFFGNNILTFVNSVATKEGGTHLIGMKNAFVKVFNDYAKTEVDFHEKLEIDDILEGASIAISLKMSEVQFGGQTKQSLTSPEARTFIYSKLKENFTSYLEENPEIAKNLIEKAIYSKKTREKIEKAKVEVRRDSGTKSVGGLASKLADCSSKDMEKCEIFVVEGDSAGGSAKQGRDRKYQAILPLRGKVLNTNKAENLKINKSKEILILAKALGTDMGENFNIEKLRYGKIILLMDADVDGSHIALLLMTLFTEKMMPLLEEGRIYIACPPLFSAKNGRSKSSKTKYYTDQKAIDLDYPDGVPEHITIGRFKGLGEMNPKELYETTMNPEKRTLQRLKLTEENKEDALKVIDELMGDDVSKRKLFLDENAQYAKITD